MKISSASLVLFSLFVASGCGSGTEAPKNAVMHPHGTMAAPARDHAWTKAEKIAVVEKAPISEDQKKSAIARINSEPGS